MYFLNPEHTKYVCLEFYSNRNYQARAEFGAARQMPVVVTPSLLATFSVHLPNLCEHLCRNEPYRCKKSRSGCILYAGMRRPE